MLGRACDVQQGNLHISVVVVIRCSILTSIDQVEVESEIINVLITNEELSIVDLINVSATVPLNTCSAGVLTVPAMFGRVTRLLISKVSALYRKLEGAVTTLMPAGKKVSSKAALKRIPSW